MSVTTTPLVSVIMPNYNHAKYLKKSISTFLHQSYPHKELIIVDDASTDNSLEIISEFTRQHPNIIVVRNQHNSGPNISWNRGTLIAQGQYLCNLDADDTLPFHSIASRLQHLLQHNLSAIHTGLTFIHPDHSSQYLSPLNLTSSEVINFLTQDSKHRQFGINSCTIMFHKDLLAEIGLKDHLTYASHADYEFSLRMIFYLQSIFTLHESTYNYHLHPTSLNARMSQDPLAIQKFHELEQIYLQKFTANVSQ